jgi:hypothetical protein
MPDRKQEEEAWRIWLEDQSAYAEEEWSAAQLPAMWLRAR